MVSNEEKQRVAGVVIETIERLGHPELLKWLRVEWKPFTSRMGDASYGRTGPSARTAFGATAERLVEQVESERANVKMTARVRFSSLIWPRASEQDRTETAIHEVCHLVARHEAMLRGRRVQPHGREWQTLMLRCGVSPDRCHSVDTTGLSNKRTVKVSCRCMTMGITPYKAGRIVAGAKYQCRKCYAYLTIDPGQAPVEPTVKIKRPKAAKRRFSWER